MVLKINILDRDIKLFGLGVCPICKKRICVVAPNLNNFLVTTQERNQRKYRLNIASIHPARLLVFHEKQASPYAEKLLDRHSPQGWPAVLPGPTHPLTNLVGTTIAKLALGLQHKSQIQ